jgi:hypothetical protein
MSTTTFESISTNQFAVNDTGTIDQASIGLINTNVLTADNMVANTLSSTTNITTPTLQTTLVESTTGGVGAILVQGQSLTGDILFETTGTVKASIDALTGGLVRRNLVINQVPGQFLKASESGAVVLLNSGIVYLPAAEDGLTFTFIIAQNDPSISISALVGNTIRRLAAGGATLPTYFESVRIVTLSTVPGPVTCGIFIVTAFGSSYFGNTGALFWTPAP